MDWNSILLWLTLGLLTGWLIELLIDYLFWQRKYMGRMNELRTELDSLRGSVTTLQAELRQASAARTSFESTISQLEEKIAKIVNGIGLLQDTSGLLGSLGNLLARASDEKEIRAKVADINAALKASTDLEDQIDQLTAKLTSMEAENVGITKRLAYLSKVEGALGSLASALSSGDDLVIQSKIEILEADLKVKADLENQISRLQKELKDIQTAISSPEDSTARPVQDMVDLVEYETEMGDLLGQLEAERKAKSEFESRICALQAAIDERAANQN